MNTPFVCQSWYCLFLDCGAWFCFAEVIQQMVSILCEVTDCLKRYDKTRGALWFWQVNRTWFWWSHGENKNIDKAGGIMGRICVKIASQAILCRNDGVITRSAGLWNTISVEYKDRTRPSPWTRTSQDTGLWKKCSCLARKGRKICDKNYVVYDTNGRGSPVLDVKVWWFFIKRVQAYVKDKNCFPQAQIFQFLKMSKYIDCRCLTKAVQAFIL